MNLAVGGSSLLVTGRAGTGKSTLLRQVRSNLEAANKVVSVVAQTGIAALNVGGETIHKHFAFRANLLSSLRNYRPPSHLADIDVLIVDEISMVRADHFDMMSKSLSRAKSNPEPFGGCQVLLFGDLFQLPPVVTDRDRLAIAEYQSAFFFSSQNFSSEWFETVELTTVFRQQGDQAFIGLLNAVRESNNIESALEILNSRVGSVNAESGPRVTLVPSNRRAHEINRKELLSLEAKIHTWAATVSGEISLADYKVDKTLEFAVGAQVMMATNEPEYVNGTMGVIKKIELDETIRVTIDIGEDGRNRLVTVGPHTWEIWRQTREESILVGSIAQLPFRLAWAVTVHRSQGQTFDRVVFDRDRGMFENGQLYVALSRCRTLAGLTLSRPLTPRDVRVSPDVLRFYRSVRASSVTVSENKSAFVGFLETGSDEYGRLLEIAICAYNGTEEVFCFNTLLNPMRDFDLSESNLTPASVTLAPTIDKARDAIALMLSGRIVVTHRSNRLQDLLSLHDVATEGLWVDVDTFPESNREQTAESSAVSALQRVLDVFRLHGASRRHLAIPVGATDATVSPGLAFLDRYGFTSTPSRVAHGVGEDHSGRLQAAVLAGALAGGEEILERQLASVSLPALKPYVGDVLVSLVESALKDGRISENERDGIGLLARSFGLELPDMPDDGESDEDICLYVGQRVCLTGQGLDKGFARSLLLPNGLLEADKVTKSGCDLVVAQSASSQSVKARAARGFGILVISLEQLIEHIERGVVERPTDSQGHSANNVDEVVRHDSATNPATIRRWAKANGIPIGDRGRISTDIRDAFTAAMNKG
jgi:hypothetical protein